MTVFTVSKKYNVTTEELLELFKKLSTSTKDAAYKGLLYDLFFFKSGTPLCYKLARQY